MIPTDLSKGRAIGRTAFQGHDLRGQAVLVWTGWDAHWRTGQYFEGHPFLTGDAAEYLLDAGVALVGIDSRSIDDTGDLSGPVHSLLLAADVPIVEHLRGLGQPPGAGFRFFAVPVEVKNLGTFPVRAFGLVTVQPRPTKSRAFSPVPQPASRTLPAMGSATSRNAFLLGGILARPVSLDVEARPQPPCPGGNPDLR